MSLYQNNKEILYLFKKDHNIISKKKLDNFDEQQTERFNRVLNYYMPIHKRNLKIFEAIEKKFNVKLKPHWVKYMSLANVFYHVSKKDKAEMLQLGCFVLNINYKCLELKEPIEIGDKKETIYKDYEMRKYIQKSLKSICKKK